MAKATVTPTRLTPLGVEDFPEPSLAQHSARFWYLLKNAVWELWRNRPHTILVPTNLAVTSGHGWCGARSAR